MTMTTEIQPDTRLTLAEWCEMIGIDGGKDRVLRLVRAALEAGDQDRVLTVPEWADAASISLRTARELLATGEGPPVIELSPNRLGIRVRDHREWLAARTKRKVMPRRTAVA
jgi:predicted DNA-binding transcriptional regulator AlpA